MKHPFLLPKLVKKQRLELGLSQPKLAERSGFSPAFISKIEQGKYNDISIDSAQRLSKALEMPLVLFLMVLREFEYDDETMIVMNTIRNSGGQNALWQYLYDEDDKSKYEYTQLT